MKRREYVQLTGVSERTALRDLAEKKLVEASGGRGTSTAYRMRETGA
jgi:predicted DNA-binding transcriptional regulator YafY